MKRFGSMLLAIGILVSCSPVSKHSLKKYFNATESEFQDHTGFVLYDVEKNKTVFDHHGNRYFTPASNTKIFTLYAGLKILDDSVPGIKYIEQNDSLIFWPTGDPSFLYPGITQNKKVFDFLSQSEHPLYYSGANDYTSHFGPGWSWEDYEFEFSVERNAFPIYGNRCAFKVVTDSLKAEPPYFQKFLSTQRTQALSTLKRDWKSNLFYFNQGVHPLNKVWKKPFTYDSTLVPLLLQDTLKKKINLLKIPFPKEFNVLYSTHVDTLYKVMMQESDNFIAEQLLILCSSVLGDSLNTEIVLRHMMDNYLGDLPDKPIIKDGSGLSRYNLVTPRTMISLWRKIDDEMNKDNQTLTLEVSRDRLFHILAVGGKSGTLKNNYVGQTPFIHAKTGTLSNVHCLSGFLVTKNGKTLIFSYLNTNFTRPVRDVRSQMEILLERIRDYY